MRRNATRRTHNFRCRWTCRRVRVHRSRRTTSRCPSAILRSRRDDHHADDRDRRARASSPSSRRMRRATRRHARARDEENIDASVSTGKSRVEQAMVLRRRGRESTLGFIVRRVRRHRDSTSRRRRRSVSAYELRFDGRGAILRVSDRPPPLFSSFTRSITIRTTTTTPTTRNEMK